MLTFLAWTFVAGVVAVVFWIANIVKHANERFDQLEHKLDVIIDQLDK